LQTEPTSATPVFGTSIADFNFSDRLLNTLIKVAQRISVYLRFSTAQPA
jgi:hypothetical protein